MRRCCCSNQQQLPQQQPQQPCHGLRSQLLQRRAVLTAALWPPQSAQLHQRQHQHQRQQTAHQGQQLLQAQWLLL
jgi:hypothetical protein